MRKISTLLSLLLFVSSMWMSAAAEAVIVPGEQVAPTELKPGDLFLMHNAVAQGQIAGCTNSDGSTQWLSGKYTTPDRWITDRKVWLVDNCPNGFDDDYVFTIEEGPANEFTGDPTVYLKCVGTGEYLYITWSSGSDYQAKGVSKDQATPLEPVLVADIAGATSYVHINEDGTVTVTDYAGATVEIANEKSGSFRKMVSYNAETNVPSWYNFGPAWNYGFVYAGAATDITFWSLFRVSYDDSFKAQLNQATQKMALVVYDYLVGDEIGFYDPNLKDALIAKLEGAQAALLDDNMTDEQYEALYNELLAADEACKASAVPLTEGYYYIRSSNAVFTTPHEGKPVGMYADGDDLLYWGDIVEGQGQFAFHITPLEDGNFMIQNVATGKYINTVIDADGNFTDDINLQVSLSDEGCEQKVGLKAQADFFIYNTKNTRAYNTQNTNNGYNLRGIICTWTSSSAASESSWHFVKITDEALIAKMKEEGAKYMLAENLQKALAAAKTARNKTIDYDEIVTRADQMLSNAQSSGDNSSFAHLIDNDNSSTSVFHTVWNSGMAAEEIDATSELAYGWHNIQFKLDEPVSEFIFNFTGVQGTTFHDNPAYISVYATNDDELGERAWAEDSTSWVHITDLSEGFPEDVELGAYTSPVINLGEAYKYLRLVVKATTHMGKHSARTFTYPSLTGITWNVSELHVFSTNAGSNAEYYTVPGMKEACDALDALMEAAPDKIAKLEVTQADVEAMQAATKAVNDLYVDRDALDRELAATIASAKIDHDVVVDPSIKLITRGDQFSTNATQNNGYGNFARLIDGGLHYNQGCESIWNAAMQQTVGLVDEEWEEYLNTTTFIHVGTGYHNFQVALDEPVDNFWIEQYGRTSTAFRDTPSKYDIYATNDPELAATTNNADNDKWTKIAEDYVMGNTYGSDNAVADYSKTDVIQLGDMYKYLRFVVKSTITVDAGWSNRVHNSPDVTGIVWNMSEFQLCQKVPADRNQYNYNAELKEATDAVQALIDEYSALPARSMVNHDKNEALLAAVEKMKSLLVDTTDLANAFKKYQAYADNAVIGEELSTVDAQSSVETYAAAIKEAKSIVSSTQPTKPQIEQAEAGLKTALATLTSHMKKLDPSKWYFFLSNNGNEEADNAGRAFYASYTIGAVGKFGKISDGIPTYSNDPYSMWRIIPIEGSDSVLLQNMYSGHYFARNAAGTVAMTNEAAPVAINYLADGTIAIELNNGTAVAAAAKTSGNTGTAVSAHKSMTSWQPVEVTDAADEGLYLTITNDYIRTACYPYAFPEGLTITDLNPDIKTFAIKNAYNDVENNKAVLELYQKKEFAAGEPMIIMAGDYTKYDSENSVSIDMAFPFPDEVITQKDAVENNGFIPALDGTTFDRDGLGCFGSNSLKIYKAGDTVTSLRGFIDPTKVVDQTDKNVDLTITADGQWTNVPEGIKNMRINKATDIVNVYSVDGKLLKKNVKATEAEKGLKKGIYVIGKDKVAVK